MRVAAWGAGEDNRGMERRKTGRTPPRAQWDAGSLRALRRHLGLTQQQFAGELGARQQTVSEWETGMYRPRGASATLLTMIAEQAGFDYTTDPNNQHSGVLMATAVQIRLPTTIMPERYRITLEPDLAAFTFTGEEAVELALTEATGRIVLHALELEIIEAHLILEDGSRVAARVAAMDDATETATLQLERTVPAGRATLHARFTGGLNDQLRGFYRSRYTGPAGEVRHLVTTQFEATDARRAFPCWDEPAFKAVFEITLVAPPGLVALSNAPVVEATSREDGKQVVRFAESPRMSTYLVAFVVGDLACVEAPAAGGVQMRVWATRGKEEQGRYALEQAVRLLDYYNGYFGVPYPLPKLDHIAIPDFAAGAMENWGAITYRETALLFDPANSAAGTRQRILEVVSHEMAHMWFGDLVTMEWWDDLWLNESFASWLGDKAVDHLFPDWHMWTQFVANDTNGG
ncbi:MAG: helix-turn-helix domain-containing protein, partial [Dehalococcoidia bacterium]|nr:helix-turn-helix domain-containing protein [Dehalococcoidia bacterium]